jgi:ABC-type multidrug transport system fused ATPase/permease subunit
MKDIHWRSLGLSFAGKPQRTFIFLQFMLLVFTFVYLLYLIYGTIESVTAGLEGSEGLAVQVAIDQISDLLLVRAAILFGVVFVVNVLLGLFFLHRLTGPLVRIKAVCNQIAEGNVPERAVNLRKGDFPTDVTEALSKALIQIRFWRDRAR